MTKEHGMKALLSGMSIALLALSLTSISTVPSVAQNMGPGPGFDRSGPDWRDNDWKRGDWNDRKRGKFERRGNYAFYNNYRGYPHRYPGYRYHNGFWFPPAAFIFGTIVGSAIANSGSGYHGNAHIAWCESTYRSYRVSDNTWQPYHGPRQYCVSPYSG
jgi:hypothetical protein